MTAPRPYACTVERVPRATSSPTGMAIVHLSPLVPGVPPTYQSRPLRRRGRAGIGARNRLHQTDARTHAMAARLPSGHGRVAAEIAGRYGSVIESSCAPPEAVQRALMQRIGDARDRRDLSAGDRRPQA